MSLFSKRMLAGFGLGVAASVAMLVAMRARAAGVPDADGMTYSGYLEDADGGPLTGDHSVSVHFYSAVDAKNDVCSGDNTNSPQLVSGRFQIALPVECSDAVKASPDVWVEVEVDGGPLGRTKLGAVPYALEAAHAASAAAVDSALAQRLAVPGMIALFGGAKAPEGWLTCDGSSLARGEYPALFAALGTAWGADDADHFTLPDLRGRFPRGADGGKKRDPGPRKACAPGGAANEVGSCEDDAFQGWMPSIRTRYGNTPVDTTGTSDYVLSGQVGLGITAESIFRPDGYGFSAFSTYGAPRVSSETRSTNVAVVYAIKY